MAEQISHNVVNHLESTSGLPLVDVAEHSTTTDSAVGGANSTTDNKSYANLPDSESVPKPSDSDNLLVLDSNVTEESSALSHGELLNGIHDETSPGDGPPDSRSLADLSVDVSNNSDTDGSRADAAETKDGIHHVRTSSVKKPATFSKVSVSKNFLARAATAAPAVVKLGDKPTGASATTQTTAKPRLVAKTGTSLRDIQKARLGSEIASGPDASKVWNKNRPVPLPPPRHFTDEELKQQYGIHLATRLQSDETGKESKWADIDDDEEDWAPETVVWMDGTKSTIAPQEASPAPKEEEATTTEPPARPEPVKPTLTTMKRPDQSMKILKPGAAVGNSTKQNGSGTSILGSEKPSLKDKTPGLAPTSKSPWAPVPKVESVSLITPPVQQTPPPPPMATQDARAYDATPMPPAREIAADTFDRSWKEGEGGSRELFNSANGRYEAVPEMRRGSKAEAGLRKTAVLRRPSQSHASPAEPSPAFQSRSTTQMDEFLAQRRRSSVSQGSFPPARRLSVTKSHDTAASSETQPSSAATNNDRTSPAHAKAELDRPPFAQQSVWEKQMPPRPESGAAVDDAPGEDPVKMQERVMREKRELAIKRRKEEEEREEAAKQERLKAKLAMLEGAGKSKKERDAEAAAVAAQNATSEPTPAEQPPPVATSAEDMPAAPSKGAEPSTAAVSAQGEDPPIPPPDQTLLGQPRDDDKLRAPAPLPPKAQIPGLPERPISSTDAAPRQAPKTNLSPRSSARAPHQQGGTYRAPSSSYSSPGDRKLQPYGRSPITNDHTFSPWPTTAPSGNVWGTSGIGNGTFDSTSSYAPLPMSQQGSSLPPPPGMGRPAASTRISPQSFGQDSRSPNLPPSQAAEQPLSLPPPGIDSRHDPFTSQSRLNGNSPAPGLGRKAHPPGPIGPPSRAQQPPAQRADPIAAWNNASQMLPQQFSGGNEAASDRKAPSAPSEHVFRERFRQTSNEPGQLGSARRFQTTEFTIHDTQGSRAASNPSPVPPSAQTQPPGPFATPSSTLDSWKQPSENPVRIPDVPQTGAQFGQSAQQPPIGPPGTRPSIDAPYQGQPKSATAPVPPTTGSKDESVPPPDIDSHPVNSGDTSHPNVKLPPPQAKVKLPPPTPAPAARAPIPPSSAAMPPRPTSNHWAPPGAAKPIVMNEAWQARFNGLFNRTPIQTEIPPSPPKTPPRIHGPALAVAPSSRALIDDQAVPEAGNATVSLPQPQHGSSPAGSATDRSGDVSSKPIIDDMFNEELSFGSLPKIHIPRVTAYDTTPYPATAKDMFKFPWNWRPHSAQLQSHPETDARFFYKSPMGYFLKISGTTLNNKLVKVDSPGAPGRKPSGSATGDSRSERRVSSKFPRPRPSKDTPVVSSSPAASSSASRKPSAQKPTSATADGDATPRKARTDTSGTDKRKTASPRSSRGSSNVRRLPVSPAAAAAASTAATAAAKSTTPSN